METDSLLYKLATRWKRTVCCTNSAVSFYPKRKECLCFYIRTGGRGRTPMWGLWRRNMSLVFVYNWTLIRGSFRPQSVQYYWPSDSEQREVKRKTSIAIQSKARYKKLFVELTELYYALVPAFRRKLLSPSPGNKNRIMNSYFCYKLKILKLCDRGPGGLHLANLFESRCLDGETLDRSKEGVNFMV